jgi:hypothetical protein
MKGERGTTIITLPRNYSYLKIRKFQHCRLYVPPLFAVFNELPLLNIFSCVTSNYIGKKKKTVSGVGIMVDRHIKIRFSVHLSAWT